MADLRFGKPQEQRRLLGLVAPGFLAVLFVVEADADDLAGIGDHRQPRHVGFLVIGGSAGRFSCFLKTIPFQKRPEVGISVAQAAAEVDNSFAGDGAVARALSRPKTR